MPIELLKVVHTGAELSKLAWNAEQQSDKWLAIWVCCITIHFKQHVYEICIMVEVCIIYIMVEVCICTSTSLHMNACYRFILQNITFASSLSPVLRLLQLNPGCLAYFRILFKAALTAHEVLNGWDDERHVKCNRNGFSYFDRNLSYYSAAW